jgi:hypothetical protein
MRRALGTDAVSPNPDIWVADVKNGNATNIAMPNIRKRRIAIKRQFWVHAVSI